MTQPRPDEVSSDEELRAAVLLLLGTSDDRAVERRVGVSKTTVNDLRNGRRRLTLKTLGLIVDAYDPEGREAWLAAWHRLHPKPARGAAPPEPAAGVTTQPAAQPGLPRRTAHVLAASALLASAAAVAAMVFVLARGDSGVVVEAASPAPRLLGPGSPGAAAPVGGPGPPPENGGPPPEDGGAPPAGGGAPPAGGGGCYSLPLPTSAAVGEGPGSGATELRRTAGLRITAGAYQYFASWNPSAAVGGRLSDRPAAGRLLIGAAWADPATADSTAAHHRGNGRFYPGEILRLTDQNCFTVQPYNLGYGGYTGITTRVYVLQVDSAVASVLPREAHRRGGLTADDLNRLGATAVGYLTIPSQP
ncbi:hypothetical protein UG55_103895 [Frankia sp. EI5c]|uniref:helix-turn-helix domain-containing protein n=1 Tax=Frankia sp. EI5c TaxID=683316 RepID=UPI0007C34BD4|nr:helix-turn-helix transcriptional regulator [Frankia sp. EI5c]OAA23397.1 hypothetical protein UG55_103895 [Frankia sp. EI5c]